MTNADKASASDPTLEEQEVAFKAALQFEQRLELHDLISDDRGFVGDERERALIL